MTILNLTPMNFRNLQNSEIYFDRHMNIIEGNNASGKTSLLEAVYFLMTGKSFKNNRVKSVICREGRLEEFVLFGKIQEENGQKIRKVGIKKSINNKSSIRVDDQNIQSASALAKISPVIIIDPSSFELISGGPGVRRKFLDWGVFHVEHSFSHQWRDYSYCLKQRNALLRTTSPDNPQLKIWNKKLVDLGAEVHTLRSKYIKGLKPVLEKKVQLLLLGEAIDIRYEQGWDKSKSLEESLESNLGRDVKRRFTQEGPHRADLKFTASGIAVEEVFSRGQQKLLVMALFLSQIEYLKEQTERSSIVLFDDVTAELDVRNLRRVLNTLSVLGTQVICSVLSFSRIEKLFPEENMYKLFHVEHGKITAS